LALEMLVDLLLNIVVPNGDSIFKRIYGMFAV
jgi:hypothetical protein